MSQHRYTIVLDFRGGTYISQVDAIDETDAVLRWTDRLLAAEPVGDLSPALAKAVLVELEGGDRPTALDGLANVWCVTASCGDDLAIANIVQSA